MAEREEGEVDGGSGVRVNGERGSAGEGEGMIG